MVNQECKAVPGAHPLCADHPCRLPEFQKHLGHGAVSAKPSLRNVHCIHWEDYSGSPCRYICTMDASVLILMQISSLVFT